jgi:8-amino-7-oxononanoate synthase
MNAALADVLRKSLEDLKRADLHRSLRALGSAPAARVRLDGRAVVNFASNNYLGLAGHPRVTAAAADAAERWGAGATASRLLGGTLEIHARLETALARLKGTEAAAVFPSGYHANMGTLQALLGKDDVVFLDRLAHASLVDGARLSGAALRVFAHNDAASLEKALRRHAGANAPWIVTESVFSMDGDDAPLRELAALAKRFGARTYVDEAHATGVRGPDGAGLVRELGLEKDIDVCMGTLSKALGGAGGFVCGTRELAEWVHNRARSFIYSTALPPASAASALAALEVSAAESARRERLFASSRRLRAALGVAAGDGPIVPLVVGSEKAALDLSRRLWDAGFFVPAIRPPTVPKGTARLRFSVTADHSEAEIEAAARVVASWRERHAA